MATEGLGLKQRGRPAVALLKMLALKPGLAAAVGWQGQPQSLGDDRFCRDDLARMHGDGIYGVGKDASIFSAHPTLLHT